MEKNRRKTSKIASFLTISRAKIQLASLPHATLGILLAAGGLSHLLSWYVLAYIVLVFAIITFACNINCLFDFEVDRKYKKYMSDAVGNLGVKNVKYLLFVEAAIILSLVYVLMADGFVVTGILALLGVFLSITYSAEPFRIKARGFWSPLPVLIGLYTLPILGGWFLFQNGMPLHFLVFAAGYALMNEGITLVNTAEDYSEDKKEGIRTWAHVFGLKATLTFAFIFTIAGLATVYALALKAALDLNTLSIILLGLATITILKTSLDVLKVGKPADLEKSAKANAPKMKIWFMITRYPLLLAALSLLL